MPTIIDRLTDALADRYRIERELGAGGMATVYLAEDLKHHRKVAIKVLREDITASVGATRFLREIEIAAQLQHPNILPLLDSGDAHGFLYYVMPYVEGQSLRQRLKKQGELPVAEAIKIIVEVVDALAYAHAHGVMHRDIKPDNVMLSGRHALVADFGVARALSEATGRDPVTSAGVALGTPAYMSPEQATADPNVDHRTDLYAVGVVAYEVLTGRPPFAGSAPQQVLAAHVSQIPEPPTRHRPGLSHELEHIVMKCLAKRPADRWQTGEELLAQLEPLATPSGGMQPTAARLPAVHTVPARRWPRTALIAGVAALVAALAIWQGVRAVRAGNGAPLVIGHASQFTAEDGLEIHPAISPDGKLVAYSAGKATQMRIYIRPVTGGRTITLSEGSDAFEFQPRWSPDGNQILYLTPSGAFVASALGGPGRLVAAGTLSVSGSSPMEGLRVSGAAWSPDGQQVVVASGGILSIVQLRSGETRSLGTSPFELHSCDWSPRGDWITCVSGNFESVVPGIGLGNIAPSSIVLISPRGGTFVEITDRKGLHQSPIWSSDGRQLYFISNQHGPRDVYVVEISADGRVRGEARRVTTGLSAQSISPSWSSGRLAYSIYTARANIWSLPIPTGEPVDAASARAVTSGNQVVEAMRVSRDGQWLLYDSNLYGNADIFRIPIAGGTPERLTTDPADDFAPDLSFDGRELAYHSWRTGTRDVFVQPLDGGPVKQVTNTSSQESFPIWSPDGRAIAFYDQLLEGGVNRGAFVTVRDGSGTWSAPVARAVGALHVTWSPDGLLVFPRAGGVEVTSATSGPARVIYTPAPNSAQPAVERPIVSEDGRLIYFKSHDADGRASLWSVPMSGGRPRVLVRFSDLSRPSTRRDYAVGAGRFFFTLEDRQSDIWIADVTRR